MLTGQIHKLNQIIDTQKIYRFDRSTPTKIENPASYPEAGYLILITHNALPFGLKVEAIKKMIERILAKFKEKIKNFK